MSQRASFRSHVLIAAAVAAAVSGTASAQAQLEEIIVTARRTAESLQETPISVTAFTAESIERRGIRNVQDLVRFTPGLSFDKGFAPQDTRPNIRGLPTTRGRPPIGILLDGIDISSESIATAGGSNLMNLKLVDVERIEVVKGPQSALYGRVAFGGAINYVSKRPSLDKQESNVSLDLATGGLAEARGSINLPVSDTVALRVNALYSTFDGFFTNSISGGDLGGWDTKGIAAALRFQPSDKVDFTARLSYSDDESGPRASYYVGQAVPGRNTRLNLPANAVGLRLGVPPGGAPLPASIPYPAIGEAQLGDKILLSVDPLTGKDYEGSTLEALVFSLVGEIDMGWATFNTWTGYTKADTLSRADADFFAAPAATSVRPVAGSYEALPALSITDLDTEAKQISQEFRLGKFDGDGLRWGVGALYWKEDYSSVNASIFIGGYFRNPPLIPAGATWSAAAEVAARGKLAGDPNYRNTEHKSAYVTLAYDLTDQLEVSAEARYSEEQFDYLFGRALSLGVNAATGALTPATFAGSVFTPSSSTDFFAPKITVNYTPVDGKLIYATASKGVKPAGFLNVGVVLDANDAKYNPEELWNYELGFKTSWMDDRLRLNGALFQMKYTDRIAQLLVPDTRSPQGTSTLVRNQGEAKVDGAELEITAALSESVTLSAGYTYLDARFIESEVPNTSALGIAGSGNCRVGNVGAQVVCFTNTNGKSLEQSAKHALVAAISYSREMTNGWTLNGEISGQWRSKRFLSPDNLVWLPKHSNVDMQVGISNDKYTVVAYANNLFDFTGATSAQSYGDPYIAFPVAPPVLAYTTYPADPRQIGIRLGMKF